MSEPKERPILFSGEMVRAILDGHKTQTRRVVKPQPRFVPYPPIEGVKEGDGFWGWQSSKRNFLSAHSNDLHELAFYCPYGEAGDRLWVREAWMYVGPGSGSSLPIDLEEITLPENHRLENVWYRATPKYEDTLSWKWSPSIHMPRWASRITLEVVCVRVERLQDINHQGALAEGMPNEGDHDADTWEGSDVARVKYVDGLGRNCISYGARAEFIQLWDGINGKKHPWVSNPWVWVVEFKRLLPPVA